MIQERGGDETAKAGFICEHRPPVVDQSRLSAADAVVESVSVGFFAGQNSVLVPGADYSVPSALAQGHLLAELTVSIVVAPNGAALRSRTCSRPLGRLAFLPLFARHCNFASAPSLLGFTHRFQSSGLQPRRLAKAPCDQASRSWICPVARIIENLLARIAASPWKKGNGPQKPWLSC